MLVIKEQKTVLDKTSEGINAAIVKKTETAATDSLKIHSDFVRKIAKMGDFEGQFIGAFGGAESGVMFILWPNGNVLPEAIAEECVRTDARGHGMTLAACACAGLKKRETRKSIAIGQRRALRKAAAPESEMVGQRKIARESIIKLTEAIGRKVKGGKKASELRHLRIREFLRALEFLEGGVELLDIITVAAPVERLVADDVLESLGDHGAFHGMEIVRQRRRNTSKVVDVGKVFHLPERIAEIPCKAVHAAIDMTECAGGLAETGGFVGAVKVFAPGADFRGGRIVQWNGLENLQGFSI